MPRISKAEKIAKAEAERAQQEQQLRDAWPTRLMAALERVSTSFTFSLKVRDGAFIVTEDNDRRVITLPYEFSMDADSEINELELRLDVHDDLIREQQRLIDLRKSALAKLTDEEADVLGITK